MFDEIGTFKTLFPRPEDLVPTSPENWVELQELGTRYLMKEFTCSRQKAAEVTQRLIAKLKVEEGITDVLIEWAKWRDEERQKKIANNL